MAPAPFIQKSERLLESIKSVNNLPDEKFNELLVDLGQPDKSLTDKYEKLHMKTVLFLMKRSKLFIMKPTSLQETLIDLGLAESKADLFLKQWTETMRPVLSNLETASGDVNELIDLSWKLDVELVSSGLNRLQRTKCPVGVINLESSAGWIENLDLDHKDLSNLYNALEEIQSEVDAMKVQ